MKYTGMQNKGPLSVGNDSLSVPLLHSHSVSLKSQFLLLRTKITLQTPLFILCCSFFESVYIKERYMMFCETGVLLLPTKQ